MITMCPRSKSHLTHMSPVTFTTEFTVARCLAVANSRMPSDVVYTSSGSRCGSVSRAPLTLEDQPVVLGDPDGR